MHGWDSRGGGHTGPYSWKQRALIVVLSVVIFAPFCLGAWSCATGVRP